MHSPYKESFGPSARFSTFFPEVHTDPTVITKVCQQLRACDSVRVVCVPG